jgi:hypothetical protein
MNFIAVPIPETTQKRWMVWTARFLSLWPVFVVVSSANLETDPEPLVRR